MAKSKALREEERPKLAQKIEAARDKVRELKEQKKPLEAQAAECRSDIAARQYAMADIWNPEEHKPIRAEIESIKAKIAKIEKEISDICDDRRQVERQLKAFESDLRKTELPPDGWEDLGFKNTMFVRPIKRWVSDSNYAELPFPEPKLYKPQFDEDLTAIQEVCDRINALAHHFELFSKFDALAKASP